MINSAQPGVDDLVPPTKLPYMKGIDGLRALAVMAVLFYHGDFSWAKGGFLGVEVFFVISGYLITSLLLVEWLRTDTIGIKAFWLRRARRLLPAVFFLLGVVSVVSLFFYRDTLYRLAGDVVASAGYVTNWFLIFKNVSYFESFGRPPFLQHLWSLSVEEQFYVLWPLIFTFGLALFRKSSKQATIRSFLALTVAGIAASTLLMVVLYTPYEDPSRVYYGTDTRAAGILVGVALSLVWIPWRLPTKLSVPYKRALNFLGAASLVGLVLILFTMNEFSPWLYRGGFLLTSLLTAVVIAVTVAPGASMGAVLENPVMKWIGLRSYGIYLWHWPIFMITRPGFDVAWHPVPVMVVRLTLTFAIAEFSYRYIETPIRRFGYRAWMASIRAKLGVRTPQAGAVLGATILAVLVALTGGLVWGAVTGDSGVVVASPAEGVLAGSQYDGSVGATSADDASEATREPNFDLLETETVVGGSSNLISVTMIGDSVLAGAQYVVEQTIENPLVIDATVSRQFKHADDAAEVLRSSDKLGKVVVLHLGTNGAFSDATFDEVVVACPI